jgi:hypothetical protein
MMLFLSMPEEESGLDVITNIIAVFCQDSSVDFQGTREPCAQRFSQKQESLPRPL